MLQAYFGINTSLKISDDAIFFEVRIPVLVQLQQCAHVSEFIFESRLPFVHPGSLNTDGLQKKASSPWRVPTSPPTVVAWRSTFSIRQSNTHWTTSRRNATFVLAFPLEWIVVLAVFMVSFMFPTAFPGFSLRFLCISITVAQGKARIQLVAS